MKKSTRLKKAAKKAAPKKVAKKAIKKAAKKAAPKKKAAIKKSWHRPQSGVHGFTQEPVLPKRIRIFGAKTKRIVYKNALINDATFLHDYVLLVKFSDGHEQQVDFSGFLNSEATPSYMKKYKAESKFKSFKVEEGNLVWGKDWDLIFPIEQLYIGKIN